MINLSNRRIAELAAQALHGILQQYYHPDPNGGLKGNVSLSAGFVYAPYIPMYITPQIYDSGSYSSSKRVNSKLYGTVSISSGSFGLWTP